MIRTGLAQIAIVAALAGCTSTATTSTPEPVPLVVTRTEIRPTEPKAVSGWIYAFQRPGDQPDLCVTIWSDETWTLGAAVSPGYYGNELDSGCVLQGNVAEFPADVLRDAGRVYTAGDIKAALDGQPIAQAGDGS